MAVKYIELSNQGVDLETLEKMTLGSLRRAVFDGDMETGSVMAGQISGLIKEIKSVKDVLQSLFDPVDQYRLSLEVMK
jgi:enoyl-[acyl-carrier protein] reductase II